MLNDHPSRNMPLFQAYPHLADAVPWMSIGDWPTPVTDARQFAALKGLGALYVKREDLARGECGGSKVRGLEFLLADAKQRGAVTIVTIGAAGSHHVSRTAWHARQLGLDTVGIVVRQPGAEYVRRNLLLGFEAGAEYIPANYATLAPRLILQLLMRRLRRGGRSCYYAPGGGTSPLACLGHVGAALELKQQIDAGHLPEPDHLYVPLGSLGTAAGLAVGCKLAGLRTSLVGVVVSFRLYCTAGRWAGLARRIHRLMQARDPTVPNIEIDASHLTVVDTALGRGYARVTEPSIRLARELHDAEGIELDGTYTAKTLDGAMQHINEHRLHASTHLFWHTYQLARPATDQRDVIASLPRALRRYFIEAVQPSV